MMVDVKIRMLWQGMAPVNSKFVRVAYENKDKLRITNVLSGEKMILSGDALKTSIKVKTGPFQDKYGGAEYYLLYYPWKVEQENQNKLPI